MSLRARIALLVAGVVIGAATASVTAVRFVAESRFRSLVRESDQTRAAFLAPVLAEYFGEEGSWEGVENVIPSMPGMRGRMGGRGHMSEALPMAMAGSRILLVDETGLVVADSGGALAGRRYTTPHEEEGVAIRTSAGVVGTVFVGTMVDRVLDPADSAFLASIARAILLAALGATVAALAVGLAMAARIARPLRELTDAAERAAGGDLDVRVSARGGGEIGRLAGAFNRMADSLREHEEGRRRMIADSAHELRTPASLIQGTVEAMLDGVYAPDRSTLEGLHEETLRLSRLVEDLGELSLIEAGRLLLVRESADLAGLVRREAERFAGAAREAGIALSVSAEAELPLVELDTGRIGQVVANLLTNALQHTPRGGRVEVGVAAGSAAQVRCAVVRVEDSGDGIPAEVRGKVFERYYRVDGARSSASGGRGLGLAIAAGIVHAHGGSISAAESRLGGACFELQLPLGGAGG